MGSASLSKGGLTFESRASWINGFGFFYVLIYPCLSFYFHNSFFIIHPLYVHLDFTWNKEY